MAYLKSQISNKFPKTRMRFPSFTVGVLDFRLLELIGYWEFGAWNIPLLSLC